MGENEEYKTKKREYYVEGLGDVVIIISYSEMMKFMRRLQKQPDMNQNGKDFMLDYTVQPGSQVIIDFCKKHPDAPKNFVDKVIDDLVPTLTISTDVQKDIQPRVVSCYLPDLDKTIVFEVGLDAFTQHLSDIYTTDILNEINNFLVDCCTSHGGKELHGFYEQHWGLVTQLYDAVCNHAVDKVQFVKKRLPSQPASAKAETSS